MSAFIDSSFPDIQLLLTTKEPVAEAADHQILDAVLKLVNQGLFA